jgi:hypothetical protein
VIRLWLPCVLIALCACGDNAPAGKTDLLAFSFRAANNPALGLNVAAQINGTSITAQVPYGSDVSHLVATFDADGASVEVSGVLQVSGVTENDFTSPVTYEVAHGIAATSYTVAITIAPSPANDITSYSFLAHDNPALATDITAMIGTDSITAMAPYGTDVSHLVATFTTTGTQVMIDGIPQTSGMTANDFSASKLYNVQAADGTAHYYTAAIHVAGSDAKDLVGFAFRRSDNPQLPANITATIIGTTITATVPYATDVTSLVAAYSTTGATVLVGGTGQWSGQTANNFTNPVTYTVQA